MKVKSLRFSASLKDIEDIKKDTISVFVKTDNGFTYNVVVGTARNLESLMDQKKMNGFEIGYPFILVKKLTKEIVEETIKAYAESNDGYWLNLYHFVDYINPSVFDQFEAEHIKEEEYLEKQFKEGEEEW